VSLATIIAISSRLRESSDGFDFESDTVQSDPKITIILYIYIYIPLPLPVWGEKHNTKTNSKKEKKRESIVYFSTNTTLVPTKIERRYYQSITSDEQF
jgi:hypothetical protein